MKAPVKITIEGSPGEVEAVLAIVATVIDLGRPERSQWGYPSAGARVRVDAAVKPQLP